MDTAEAREIRQHIDALKVVKLIQLMDHARLNIRGAIDDLRNRYLRAEVRCVFGPEAAAWDLVKTFRAVWGVYDPRCTFRSDHLGFSLKNKEFLKKLL